VLYYDWSYYLFALPGLLLGLWAQATLRSTFARYSQAPTANGANGLETAQALIRLTGVQVGVQDTPGFLSDYYDPSDKSIHLSQSSTQASIASVAVVAHEMGHAVQDAKAYGPMRARAAIVPAVSVSAWVAPVLFIAGMAFNSPSLLWVGIIAFGAAALFALMTLPVEFDASRRALLMLEQAGLLQITEVPAARAVLRAAALTYVAAAAQSIGILFYYLSVVNRRRS